MLEKAQLCDFVKTLPAILHCTKSKRSVAFILVYNEITVNTFLLVFVWGRIKKNFQFEQSAKEYQK